MEEKSELCLDAQYVQLHVPARDWREAIRAACRPLIREGCVTSGYPEDVIERESQWPTGLPTVPIAVAIPHALRPDNVVRAQISACLLEQPVPFFQSGGTKTDAPVDVQLVFILALKDAKEQLALLQKLMVAISDEEMLASLLHAGTPEEFSNRFNGSAAHR